MSFPSRAAEAEARQADVAFQIALAQVGVGTLEDALTVWEAMDPTAAGSTAADWLAQAVHLILTRRRLSRDLAMAYYRLARALRTGSTIRDPFGPPEPEYVTIGTLRREFRLLVEDIDVMHRPGGEEQAPETLAEDAETDDPAAPAETDDTETIPLEELPGLKEAELKAEADAEAALEKDLMDVGPTLFKFRIEGLDDETPLGDARSQEERLKAEAGVRTARAAEKAAMNGGRGSAFTYGSLDKRVIAWARVSLSGDPCYFCAMLISRGAVYKSNQTGTFDDSGDLYHDNCRCVAVPIYSESQFATDPRYDQSRALSAMWTKGMSLKEWRALIDERRRTGDTPWVRPSDTPAQVAG